MGGHLVYNYHGSSAPQVMPLPMNPMPIAPIPAAFQCPLSVSDFIPPSLMPTPSTSAGTGLIQGTAKAFLKDAIPPAVGVVGLVASAAIAGHKLAENIDKALDDGQSRGEAYVCQTAKTVTQEVAGKVFKGAVVAGIPTYMAAAVVDPPLAAAAPVVFTLIPTAYQGAQQSAAFLGNVAEMGCHKGFEFARKLSEREGQ